MGVKVLKTHTIRGVVRDYTESGDVPYKVQLFDGRFDTGYRIKRFEIFARLISNTSAQNFACKVMNRLHPKTLAVTWAWEDQSELAWSIMSMDGNAGGSSPNYYSAVDTDKIVIEDLYIYCHSSNLSVSQYCNFILELEQVEITDAHGALVMANDKATDSGVPEDV